MVLPGSLVCRASWTLLSAVHGEAGFASQGDEVVSGAVLPNPGSMTNRPDLEHVEDAEVRVQFRLNCRPVPASLAELVLRQRPNCIVHCPVLVLLGIRRGKSKDKPQADRWGIFIGHRASTFLAVGIGLRLEEKK